MMPPTTTSTEAFAKMKSQFLEQIELESIRPRLKMLCESGKASDAVEELKNWIIGNPLDERAFLLLGELYEASGETNAAVVAFQRALQLKEVSAIYKPSTSLLRFREIEAGAANKPESSFFPGFNIKPNGPDERRKEFLKSHEEHRAQP